MLLPVYNKYERYFLNEPLYNYIRYDMSMSQREAISPDEKITTYNTQKNIIVSTLDSMELADNIRNYYKNLVFVRYSRLIFSTAYSNGMYDLLKNEYNELKKLNQISLKVRLRSLIARIRIQFLNNF